MSIQRLNVLVAGSSGRGKSSSLEKLITKLGDAVVVLNTELKELPFKGISQFIETYSDLTAAIKRFKEDPQKKVLVIDSLTAISEMLFRSAVQKTKGDNNGFAKYQIYKETFSDFLFAMKRIGKPVICTSLDEQSDGDIQKRQAAVSGKALGGAIEAAFTVVLWAQINGEGKDKRYQFATQSDGKTAAKSPRGMFSEEFIPNDLNYVFEAARKHYA